MLEVLLIIWRIILFLWCSLCCFTCTAAALTVGKKEGILAGVITALMLATPWLLLI